MGRCCCDSGDTGKVKKMGATKACCESNPPPLGTFSICPECAGPGKKVLRVTLEALVKSGKRSEIPIKKDEFYFCKSETCSVVYFASNRVVFWKNDLNVIVGIKEPQSPAAPVCYCFGWTRGKIEEEIKRTGKSSALEQIKAQIKAGRCSCATANPQGSCCLGDAGKVIEEITGRIMKS